MNKIQTKKVEVDQSVRIEELTKDTILGIANKQVSFTVVVSKRTKRVLREMFRVQGRTKKFAPYLFAAAIVEGLKHAPFQTSDIIVDIEYPGYEREIIQIIKQVYSGIEVYFTAIGKKSYAHFTAYGVYIGKRKADLRIDTKKIAEILFGETKNGPRTVTPRNESGDSQPK